MNWWIAWEWREWEKEIIRERGSCTSGRCIVCGCADAHPQRLLPQPDKSAWSSSSFRCSRSRCSRSHCSSWCSCFSAGHRYSHDPRLSNDAEGTCGCSTFPTRNRQVSASAGPSIFSLQLWILGDSLRGILLFDWWIEAAAMMIDQLMMLHLCILSCALPANTFKPASVGPPGGDPMVTPIYGDLLTSQKEENVTQLVILALLDLSGPSLLQTATAALARVNAQKLIPGFSLQLLVNDSKVKPLNLYDLWPLAVQWPFQ